MQAVEDIDFEVDGKFSKSRKTKGNILRIDGGHVEKETT